MESSVTMWSTQARLTSVLKARMKASLQPGLPPEGDGLQDSIRDALIGACLLKCRSAVVASYDAIEDIVKEILFSNEVASLDQCLLEATTRKLLEILLSANRDILTERERRRITVEIGPCSQLLMKKALEETKRIKQCFADESTIRTLLQSSHGMVNGFPAESKSQNDLPPFGSNLQVNAPARSAVVDFGLIAYQEESSCPVESSMVSLKPPENDENHLQGSLFHVLEALSLSFSDAAVILESLMKTLKSSTDEVALQSELCDLLGLENIDLIGYLLLHRESLLKEYTLMTVEQFQMDQLLEKAKRKVQPVGIAVETGQQKALSKEVRKMEKKVHRLQKVTGKEQMEDVDVARRRQLEYEKASRQPRTMLPSLAVSSAQSLPYVFDTKASIASSNSSVKSNSLWFGEDGEHLNSELYEEVTIPAVVPSDSIRNLPRVSIADLDPMSQQAFEGYPELNLIQSIVYPQARHSHENLLICAPTGAGKTNIALLCILRTLEDFTENGVLRKDDFKIVYIAPMKALAGEMVRNIGSRLSKLGVSVRELTGDMHLSKSDICKTQMLISTPEKWDVVTRKACGDVCLSQLVRLLIIDEVHLLHDERGAVLESLVARSLRQVKIAQQSVRLVGLSATLPNYMDVAQFLCVNPCEGLFFFDARFRPVPLTQTFIGVKGSNSMEISRGQDRVCYEKVVKFLRDGHQVMVFVHSRSSTYRTAVVLSEMASNDDNVSLFIPDVNDAYCRAQKMVLKSHNGQLKTLFTAGFGIHHAGMLRQDRNLVERLFSNGHIRVLCCTSTLAWGINLPAHAVIIRGTDVYDAKRGAFVDVGILDVQQIFGRAGRPQYESHGHGVIITNHDKFHHYLRLMTNQTTIESQFLSNLCENLNAEICLDSVSTVSDAVEWFSYTYMFVRAKRNPVAYGITMKEYQADPDLQEFRRCCIVSAARQLERLKMIRFNETNGYFYATDLGRIASAYYLKCGTVEILNHLLGEVMSPAEVLAAVAKSTEFENFKIRDDEFKELDDLLKRCRFPVQGGCSNAYGKVNILLQAYVARVNLTTFSLISDSAFVSQNSGRILRALFEITLRQNTPILAAVILRLCKSVEWRHWWFGNPLWQMESILRFEKLEKIDNKGLTLDKLMEMSASEIGHMLRDDGHQIKNAVERLPYVEIESIVQPITRTIIRINLKIIPAFIWDDRVHGRNPMLFHVWIVDADSDYMYHREEIHLTKKQVMKEEVQELVFTVPITEPMPSQYLVEWMSDQWIGCEGIDVLSFENLILPTIHPPHTKLLDLKPLPVGALGDTLFQSIYTFSHFNAVQTQMFFTLFHSDHNALVGAPTGSGKTVAAELAILRVFKRTPKLKCVYIAPLKALVRERMRDWQQRLEGQLGKRIVELTGDSSPDAHILATSDVVVTTPEKWDGISRSWQNRSYVRDVALIVIDEIHLLGEDRGPVLEVIVSRINYITATTGRRVRIIGLSTALANASDLADWLGIKKYGMFNFPPSVRPVPLEVHLSGFAEKRYCPRMATMNKPAYKDIKVHSAGKPVLIFVSSRRQTRLTSFDLIAHLVSDANPRRWLRMSDEEVNTYSQLIRDPNLRLSISFGIGLHHAGLKEVDRHVVEELFVNQKIQVLIATATLAWGVNLPAHLVIVKGTEYYDGKSKRYVDFPVTDVLQMIGRAGRPQYDDQGIAVVYVLNTKKQFYRKFLYEPFPVESSLLKVLPDHLNAEIVAGTIGTKQQALDYLTWTYFFRRLMLNPSYYGAENLDKSNLNAYLSNIVNEAVHELEQSYCVEIEDDQRTLCPQTPGRIASFYYLSHKTVKMFLDRLTCTSSVLDLVATLTSVPEYDEIPVRHNEDAINSELAKHCVIRFDESQYDDAHVKTHLLYQAHFLRLTLPSVDYETDLKSILDQAIRIIQAMFDVVAEQGWLATAIRAVHLLQMVVQGRFIEDPPFSTLPHLDVLTSKRLISRCKVDTLPHLMERCRKNRNYLLTHSQGLLDPDQVEEVLTTLSRLPVINVSLNLLGRLPGHGQPNAKRAVGKISSTASREWIEVYAEEEYVLNVTLKHASVRPQGESRRAIAPRFPKTKDEGWFVIVGTVEKADLQAVRRVSPFDRQASTNLLFSTPATAGRVIYTVYVLSDSYMGLDQQYDLCLDVGQPCPSALLDGEKCDEGLTTWRDILQARLMLVTVQLTVRGRFAPSEVVHLVGSCPELGAWHVNGSRTLKKANDEWTDCLVLLLDEREEVSFRFFTSGSDPADTRPPALNIVRWEAFPEPRRFVASTDETVYSFTFTFGENGGVQAIRDGWLMEEREIRLIINRGQLELLGENKSMLKLKIFTVNRLLGASVSHQKCWPCWLAVQGEVGKFQKNCDTSVYFEPDRPVIVKSRFCHHKGLVFQLQFYEVACGNSTLLGSAYLFTACLGNSCASTVLPVLDSANTIVGSVTIQSTIVNPMKPICSSLPRTIHKSIEKWGQVMIGHRGVGSSFGKQATVCENTIASFELAALQGADFVEFDVQVTEDKVPVVYHDFFVNVWKEANQEASSSPPQPRGRSRRSSTLSKIPLHSVDLNALRMLGMKSTSNPPTPDVKVTFVTHNGDDEQGEWHVERRPFPTLQQVLVSVPETLGFNVEVKYPQRMCYNDTGEKEGVDGVLERNEYVDLILKDILQYAGNRSIVFSSFDPDVCIMLRLKQNLYPILFLTQGECKADDRYLDERTHTSMEAVRFAYRNDLQGVVFHAEDLLRDKSPFSLASELNLVSYVWGSALDKQEHVDHFLKLGFKGIIMDNIDKRLKTRPSSSHK